jgi:zinc protease
MLNRTIPPVKFQNTKIVVPKVTSTLLENGVPIHIINQGTHPFFKLEVVFRNGGSWNDNKVGASTMVAKTLQSGTKNYSAETISNFIAQKGAILEVSPSFDYTIVSLYGLNKYIEDLLPVLKDIIVHPIFPKNELTLQKDISISQLKTQNKKTNIVASKQFRNLLYSSNNPYGRIATESTTADLQRTDLTDQFEQFFNAFEIIISGNITKEVKGCIDKYFGRIDYKYTENTSIKYSVENLTESKHFPFENAIQTSMKIGKRVVQKTHSDYPALVITNHILGGFFGSRLMKNLREDKGLTYGVHSSIVSLKNDAFFVISSDIKGEDKDKALSETNKELEILSSDLVDSKELEIVKNHLIGSFQADISSPLALSEKFKSVYLYNLSSEYFEKYLDEINTITPEKIRSIAQKYFQSSTMNIVTVGA